MELIDRELFLEKSKEALIGLYQQIDEVQAINWQDFNPEQTAVIIVDVINGFVKEGPLSSPRIAGIIPSVVNIMEEANRRNIPQIAFADFHDENSPEFGQYPIHCMGSSQECKLVDEIIGLKGYTLVNKNSTNGFLVPEFQQWLAEHEKINQFILVGDCTDICVMQFGLTLKCWFNQQNKQSDIVVPLNAVETFELGSHDGDLMNIMALNFMIAGGIRVVKEIGAL